MDIKKKDAEEEKARECRLQAGDSMEELAREAAGLKKDYLYQADIKKLEAW